jgi:hypothetical protein
VGTTLGVGGYVVVLKHPIIALGALALLVSGAIFWAAPAAAGASGYSRPTALELTNSGTGAAIPGASFSITGPQGVGQGTFVTGSAPVSVGNFTVGGIYVIKEVSSPPGYALVAPSSVITPAGNDTYTIYLSTSPGSTTGTTAPGRASVSLSGAKEIPLGEVAQATIHISGISVPSVVVWSLLRGVGACSGAWVSADVVKTVRSGVNADGNYTLVAGEPSSGGCYAWEVDLYVNGALASRVAPGGGSEFEVVASVTSTAPTTTQSVTSGPTTLPVTTTTRGAPVTTTQGAPVTTTTVLIIDTTTTSLVGTATTLGGTSTTLAGAGPTHHSNDIWLLVILILLIVYFAYDIFIRRRR